MTHQINKVDHSPPESVLNKYEGDKIEDVANSADDSGPTDRFGGDLVKSAEEKALVRKLDMRVMPILWAMYFLK